MPRRTRREILEALAAAGLIGCAPADPGNPGLTGRVPAGTGSTGARIATSTKNPTMPAPNIAATLRRSLAQTRLRCGGSVSVAGAMSRSAVLLTRPSGD